VSEEPDALDVGDRVKLRQHPLDWKVTGYILSVDETDSPHAERVATVLWSTGSKGDAMLGALERAPKPMFETSPEDRERVLQFMNSACEETYWRFFAMGFGSNCHAFLEFCGLMSKFRQLCQRAHEAGMDFTHLNIHSGEAIPMEAHDVIYLAEKFECIFGSFFHNNPKMARLFAKKALGLEKI
jgi:hypothetical protein